MKNKQALYIDNTRTPIETIPGYDPWIVVRDYEEFVEYIKTNGIPDYISFEHDLSTEHMIDFVNHHFGEIIAINYNSFTEKTGYDCAVWLCNYIEEQHELSNIIELKIIGIHSVNIIGSTNILNYINNFKKQKGWEQDAFLHKPKFEIIEDKN